MDIAIPVIQRHCCLGVTQTLFQRCGLVFRKKNWARRWQ